MGRKKVAGPSLFDEPPASAGPGPYGGELPAQRHSATSVAAAEAMKPSAAKQRADVLRAITAAGTAGLTDEECQKATGLNGSSQRPRRVELFTAGLVNHAGRTRKTDSGRDAAVWVAAVLPTAAAGAE
jgi:hypothetical protein